MVASRPGSTVSYGRNEHLPSSIYASSPGPEQALAGSQAFLTHQEAMDRFNVSNVWRGASNPAYIHYFRL